MRSQVPGWLIRHRGPHDSAVSNGRGVRTSRVRLPGVVMISSSILFTWCWGSRVFLVQSPRVGPCSFALPSPTWPGAAHSLANFPTHHSLFSLQERHEGSRNLLAPRSQIQSFSRLCKNRDTLSGIRLWPVVAHRLTIKFRPPRYTF